MIIFLLSMLSYGSFPQEITEENYRKSDKELWEEYEQQTSELRELAKANPAKADSIQKEMEFLQKKVLDDNAELAVRFASVPSGLQRVFRTRLRLPKERLQQVVDSLPAEMKENAYAKSIQAHIDTEQIKEGDTYADFEAFDPRGNTFRLSSFEGKNVLFIYGGLDCMGKSGREYLDKIHTSMPEEEFGIVVYCPLKSQQELKNYAAKYPVGYHLVSDFKEDHSPIKIRYGAQAQPTYFLIGKSGIIHYISTGLDEKHLDSFFLNSKSEQ